MKYNLSQNIETPITDNFNYIVTGNARRIFSELVDGFNSGVHSFTIVGTYGTGKSSFLRALQSDINNKSHFLFTNKGQFGGLTNIDFRPIVGDYTSFISLLSNKLNPENEIKSISIFKELDGMVSECKKENKLLLIAVDEFGKVLEHAANNNPERELYFIQQFAEYVNRPENNILFITTLHQNFGAYSRKLSEHQRNEWTKVKGRFKELVFSEPVEQLLHLAAEQLNALQISRPENTINELFYLAQNSKVISPHFKIDIAHKLYPLDMFSATALTQAIQRYGQNERSLFSFLNTQSSHSLKQFTPNAKETYNLSYVYDYVIYNFHSFLSEVNADTLNWSAMRVALERVEGFLEENEIPDASKIVKAIGLLNLLGSSAIKVEKDTFCEYAEKAMNINHPEILLEKLTALKIIRFANYKSQYILFDGTDINIEDELYKAKGQIPLSVDIVNEVNTYFNFRIIPAKSVYYKKGTPRFFQFKISADPIDEIPKDDTDGFINLIFSQKEDDIERICSASQTCKNAILFGYFKNTKTIKRHLREIQKLLYVRDQVLDEKTDVIAIREVGKLLSHEKSLLNKSINESFTTFTEDIVWFYNGEIVPIRSFAEFNKLLSRICEEVYFATPIVRNELFNKQKVSSAISIARVNLLSAIADFNPETGIQFEKDKYPPEKTIFNALLVDTGIHQELEHDYLLGRPIREGKAMHKLWLVCEEFVQSSQEKQRKLVDLIKTLKAAPFKLKQGFIDFWLPTYLLIKKQDYSLYDANGFYIPEINKEVLDLLQKSPNEFKIKAFAMDGVKVEFFNQYRRLINQTDKEQIKKDSFIETIKPFLSFYNRLNKYSQTTENFDNPTTAKFRNVLANATDPEKAFFEDLPEALGFKNSDLSTNSEFMSQYQDLIQRSIDELRSCYRNLIERLEASVIQSLGLKSTNFNEYKIEIENRYKSIKEYLLSPVQKAFLTRLFLSQPNKTGWYEAICYVLLNKPLSSLKDNEEALLIDKLRYMFNALTKFIDISAVTNKGAKDEIYKFDLASTEGTIYPKAFVLPENQRDKVEKLEESINNILSGDENIDVCTLLRILNKRIEK